MACSAPVIYVLISGDLPACRCPGRWENTGGNTPVTPPPHKRQQNKKKGQLQTRVRRNSRNFNIPLIHAGPLVVPHAGLCKHTFAVFHKKNAEWLLGMKFWVVVCFFSFLVGRVR